MFGEILDIILFPVKELLKLLVDQRITDYLGFSPMVGIVTLLVITIVVKALVNTTYVGLGSSSLIHSRRRAEYRSFRQSRSDQGNNNG